ncbi:LOW QUALITY PROTEIN: hypothetical protein Cgig2_021913 [Carnegiea gigantea]|uniref:Uncharacterized protein n=1 Tax=Carnegiea gigantea TaxID=171969 RepID=A0A9Q1JWI5_9CARY|nr:LOW QUALITY PROTEIN: hypothetical protein Cgig2_021913 [Carnegiea gigantea]
MSALQGFHACAGLKANHTKSEIVFGGCHPHLHNSVLKSQPGNLPFKYLGVPITASKSSKLECRILMEKILGKIRLWSTKSISFTGRAQLLNSIIFGMYNYWAKIFILPHANKLIKFIVTTFGGVIQTTKGLLLTPGTLHVFPGNMAALGLKPSSLKQSVYSKIGLGYCYEK